MFSCTLDYSQILLFSLFFVSVYVQNNNFVLKWSFQGHIGRTALHWSVNDTATVQLLLQGKPQLDLVDDNGATPLLLSIAHSQPLTSKVLIEAGCDIHKVRKYLPT